MSERTFRVTEFISTFQGEGLNMGRKATFVRLYGCDQRCPWCDSKETWHKDHEHEAPTKSLTAHLIAKHVQPGAFVVITGGEPTLWPVLDLVKALHGRGCEVAIETAGHRPLRGEGIVIDDDVDIALGSTFITCSPKLGQIPPIPQIVRRADEFKLIITKPSDIKPLLAMTEGGQWTAPRWLHPEWSVRDDLAVRVAICDAVKFYGANDYQRIGEVRAGFQMHKFYGADDLGRDRFEGWPGGDLG